MIGFRLRLRMALVALVIAGWPASGMARAAPGLIRLTAAAPSDSEEVLLLLHEVRIVGATAYGAQDLSPLYRHLVGRRVSLHDIQALAGRITAKYLADGYVLSSATVPVQEIDPRSAVVRIQVIEGYVDKVEWTADLSRYRDFFSYYAARITAEHPANRRTIERYTLLAEDLPGIAVSTHFRRSNAAPGASTLVVEIKEKALDVYARAEFLGKKGQQTTQFVGSAAFNNLAGWHEGLTVSYLNVRSTAPLQFAVADYRQVLTSEGLTGLIEASYGWGAITTAELELPDGPLSVTARSRAIDAGLSYPLSRSRDYNLTLFGLMFLDDRQSVVLPVPQIQDRLRGLRLKADGDATDALKASYNFTFIFSHGIEGLGSTRNGNPIASNPAGRVDFAKLEGYVDRTQSLPGDFSLKLSGYFQYAFTALQQQEQCSFGGRVLGRGFDPGGLLGDTCWQASAELRYDRLGGKTPFSQIQFYGFADHGYQVNIKPADGAPRNFDASSAGAGLRLGWPNEVKTDFFVAKAIEGPTRDWRLMLFTEVRF
jgi:hemolysin activation/secretion protein